MRALIILTMLAGCASMPPRPATVTAKPATTSTATGYDPNLSKPGGTAQTYAEDRLECLRTDRAQFLTCMAVRGWHMDPKGFPPPYRS